MILKSGSQDPLSCRVQLQPWSNSPTCDFLMILKTLISMLRCAWLGLELNSAGKWILRARFEDHCSISSIICLSKMRLKWSKHIMQCNPMMIERWRNKRSSKAWWSHLNMIFLKKKKKCLDNTYYNDFWRSCDTEDWSNDAENSALITAINYISTYILYI